MKMEGRLGATTSFGNGSFISSNEKKRVICTTSGCGEEIMRERTASFVCDKFLDDFKKKEQEKTLVLNDICKKFNSKKEKPQRTLGILVVSIDLENPKNIPKINWAHTTSSFAIGFCSAATSEENNSCLISRLSNSVDFEVK